MEWPDWALGHNLPFKIRCEPAPVGSTVFVSPVDERKTSSLLWQTRWTLHSCMFKNGPWSFSRDALIVAFLCAANKSRFQSDWMAAACVSVGAPPAVDEKDNAESVGGPLCHASCPRGSSLQQPAEQLQLSQSLPALLRPLGLTSHPSVHAETTFCPLMRLQKHRHQT